MIILLQLSILLVECDKPLHNTGLTCLQHFPSHEHFVHDQINLGLGYYYAAEIIHITSYSRDKKLIPQYTPFSTTTQVVKQHFRSFIKTHSTYLLKVVEEVNLTHTSTKVSVQSFYEEVNRLEQR